MMNAGRVHAGFARAWFDFAARNGGVDMVWRIVDELSEWGDPRQANEWMQAAIGAEFGDQPDGITVDRNMFALVVDDRGIVCARTSQYRSSRRTASGPLRYSTR
jgi:hypothetical protein